MRDGKADIITRRWMTTRKKRAARQKFREGIDSTAISIDSSSKPSNFRHVETAHKSSLSTPNDICLTFLSFFPLLELTCMILNRGGKHDPSKDKVVLYVSNLSAFWVDAEKEVLLDAEYCLCTRDETSRELQRNRHSTTPTLFVPVS